MAYPRITYRINMKKNSSPCPTFCTGTIKRLDKNGGYFLECDTCGSRFRTESWCFDQRPWDDERSYALLIELVEVVENGKRYKKEEDNAWSCV